MQVERLGSLPPAKEAAHGRMMENGTKMGSPRAGPDGRSPPSWGGKKSVSFSDDKGNIAMLNTTFGLGKFFTQSQRHYEGDEHVYYITIK